MAGNSSLDSMNQTEDEEIHTYFSEQQRQKVKKDLKSYQEEKSNYLQKFNNYTDLSPTVTSQLHWKAGKQ